MIRNILYLLNKLTHAMKKNLLISLLFFTFTCSAQLIVKDSVILHLNNAQVIDYYNSNGIPPFLFPPKWEVDVHRVIYHTPDPHGVQTIASGLVIIPTNDTCPAPMMTYLHGTQMNKHDVFSNLNGEWFIGVVAATTGYAAAFPDYLGLGVSPGLHPYQHAASEASCAIDLLRALRQICDSNDVDLNGQLFVMGYSQGGHAAMATHREIQQHLSGEFTVTASAPMSGPYDLSGVQFEMVASFDPYSQPGYLPYLVMSFQSVYGNLYSNYSEIFKHPYDSIIPPLILSGTHWMGDVNNVMPSVPRLIIDSTYAAAFFSDTLHPAMLALKDNDVYDWLPQAPMRMGYCTSDQEVTYRNAIVALNRMHQLGANNVNAVCQDTTLSHFDCARPSILFTKFWFDSMAQFCQQPPNSILSPEFVNTQISFRPNPCMDELNISFSNSGKEEYTVYIVDMGGRIIRMFPGVMADHFTCNVSGLNKGSYIVMADGKKPYWGKLVKQ